MGAETIDIDLSPEPEHADAREAEQLALLPEQPLVPRLRHVRLDRLPPDEELVGPPPDRSLVESIKHLGLLEPVLLTGSSKPDDRAHSGLRVLDGRRRVKAARRAGLREIPCLVVETAGLVGSTVAVAKHATRRDNLAAELAAVESMAATGRSEQEIAAATGLGPERVRQRLRLRGLHPDLRAALASGTLSAHAATEAVRLPGSAQEDLADRLRERGKLTARDLADARRARAAVGAASLPFGALTATPSADDPAAGPDWHGDGRERQGQQEGAAPSGSGIAPAWPDGATDRVSNLIGAALAALAYLEGLHDAGALAAADGLREAIGAFAQQPVISEAAAGPDTRREAAA